MFEFIRTHQRLMQFLLLLFIFPSFAFFGIESYSRFSNSQNVVAKVGGQPITQQEWDAAHREQMERFRQAFGAQFDPKMFDTPEARKNILDGLIAQKALAIEAANLHMTVPDQVLQRTILDIPGLKKPDGSFDVERYKALLGAQGLTPERYQESLRHDLVIQQLNAAVQTTVSAPKTVLQMLSDANEQERSAQSLMFKNSDFIAQVKVTDDMLRAYYDKNSSQFSVPEQAKIEYLVLNREAIAPQITVSDADAKAYYEQNKKRFAVDEQRRASHILINAKKDAPEAEKKAAKAKADALLAEVRKNPGSFAQVAKKNSQDPGSAEQGGDLGFFGKGAMVKPFEDTAYRLKEGEISDVVQSDFGFHIIQLTGIKPATTKTFEEAKPEIVAEIRKQQATKKFADLSEQFNNLVYEQADSLKPAADKLNLKIETASGVTRQPDPAVPPTAVYNDAKFLRALFSDEVLKNKHNTEAVEVSPGVLVAGRVAEYKPASKKSFDEVKGAVREQVVQIEAAKLAAKAGEAKLAALKAKDDATGFGEAKTVSRIKNQGWPRPAFDAVMTADVSKLPTYQGAEIPGFGYGVYRIVKVAQPATPDPARRQTEQQQISETLAQQQMIAFINALKAKVKVEIVKPVAPEGESGKTADAK